MCLATNLSMHILVKVVRQVEQCFKNRTGRVEKENIGLKKVSGNKCTLTVF